MSEIREHAGRDVIDLIARARIVPVLTIDDAADAVPLVEALVAGGLPLVEITLRTSVGLDAIERVSTQVDNAIVGAGSVTSADDAANAVGAGARFLVSPGTDTGVLEAADSAGVLAVPGIATATELMRAVRAGVDVVKVFPVEQIGGPALIDALAAVWPTVRFLPTGGITASTAPDYLERPSVLAVGGSWMVPATAVTGRDWIGVTVAASHAATMGRRTP